MTQGEIITYNIIDRFDVARLFETMSEDMDKIFEISVNKIEHTRSRINVCGKSSLHRTLLVNSVINRVRNSDRILVNNEQEMPLMNYREPKRIIDMDDYESEKTFTECQTRCTNQLNNNTTVQRRKVSSLVTRLNSRSMCGKINEPLLTKHRMEELDGKENVVNNTENFKRSDATRRSSNCQKRLYSSSSSSSSNMDYDEPCPKKKLRCIWPNNIGQDLNFSITGLASLFGDLVASSDAEKSNITLNGNFATAMVAC